MAHFIGTPTRDVYQGGDDDDLLEGLDGSDTLRGGRGNDSIYGGNDRDELHGEQGNDAIYGEGGRDDLSGDNGNDTLYGDIGEDTLSGGKGDDYLDGGDGYDIFNGGEGNDYLDSGGGPGNETLDGGAGADTMIGSNSREVYIVDDLGDVVIEKGAGLDDTVESSISYKLAALVENLYLVGTADLDGWGNDEDNSIYGTSGVNRLYGKGGDDQLTGYGGDDRLDGGWGDDELDGGAGVDRLFGGTGYDTYYVDDARDHVDDIDGEGIVRSTVDWDLAWSPGLHELQLSGFYPDTNAWGTDLADTISGTDGDNVIYGGAGNDDLHGDDRIIFGAGNDTLYGEAGNDHLSDGFMPGGSSQLYGGTGDDIYSVADGNAIHELAGEGTDTWDFGFSDYENVAFLPDNVENMILWGESGRHYTVTGNDLDNRIAVTDNSPGAGLGDGYFTIYAEGGDDTMLGADGDDILDGGSGDDVIDGGALQGKDDFSDTLIGGEGADTFILHPQFQYWSGDTFDTITDFEHTIDTIQLERGQFRNLGGTGELDASRFHVGTEATTAGQRIIFDASTGALYYDKDGTGAEAQDLIGNLSVTNGALDHTDFAVV